MQTVNKGKPLQIYSLEGNKHFAFRVQEELNGGRSAVDAFLLKNPNSSKMFHINSYDRYGLR